MAAARNFVALSSIVCIAQCDNKFILPTLPIAKNLCKYNKALYTICKSKEASHGHFYNDE